jgi:4a-hydroxytetrahydrobiopterin dehydratase
MQPMTDLTQKKCVPCEGGMDPLTQEQEKMYHSAVPEWQIDRSGIHSISRKTQHKNFAMALEFVNKIGELAESEGHHPDISLHDFKFVTIVLYTHAIGGLSENDFIMAAKIDQFLKS